MNQEAIPVARCTVERLRLLGYILLVEAKANYYRQLGSQTAMAA
jgi:hypothetical protein